MALTLAQIMAVRMLQKKELGAFNCALDKVCELSMHWRLGTARDKDNAYRKSKWDLHAAIALCQLKAYFGKFGSANVVTEGSGTYFLAVLGALAAVRKYLSAEPLAAQALQHGQALGHMQHCCGAATAAAAAGGAALADMMEEAAKEMQEERKDAEAQQEDLKAQLRSIQQQLQALQQREQLNLNNRETLLEDAVTEVESGVVGRLSKC
jgi:hypothetical protein